MLSSNMCFFYKDVHHWKGLVHKFLSNSLGLGIQKCPVRWAHRVSSMCVCTFLHLSCRVSYCIVRILQYEWARAAMGLSPKVGSC